MSASRLRSMTGTEGLATVNTEGCQPNSDRYLTNFTARCTPAPPTGGKRYETISTRRGAAACGPGTPRGGETGASGERGAASGAVRGATNVSVSDMQQPRLLRPSLGRCDVASNPTRGS